MTRAYDVMNTAAVSHDATYTIHVIGFDIVSPYDSYGDDTNRAVDAATYVDIRDACDSVRRTDDVIGTIDVAIRVAIDTYVKDVAR